MPWHVARSSSCPDSRPWAVIKDSDGSVVACHATRSSASRQVAALYANEGKHEMTQRFEHKRAFEVVEFKALSTKGEFEAMVAAFGNVDRIGDKIAPTAFDKTLDAWGDKGDPIPIIWSHLWDQPEAHIGEADPNDVTPTEKGLHVKRGKMDVDRPFAEQVHHLMSKRRVKEFSFGYNIPAGGAELKDGVNNLLEIELFEFGPTLKGMNPETELLAVKALASAVDGTQPGFYTSNATFSYAPLTIDLASLKADGTYSKAVRDRVRRLVRDLNTIFAEEGDDKTESDEAEAEGKASDPDEDIMTAIRLLEE